jgi:hypothetical protein
MYAIVFYERVPVTAPRSTKFEDPVRKRQNGCDFNGFEIIFALYASKQTSCT